VQAARALEDLARYASELRPTSVEETAPA
jgi:hypothetical protein